MKYTNKTGLPEALFKALSNDDYKKEGHFTASELPTPPQIWVLRNRYKDEITEDVSDRIYPLIGSNTHYILERAGVKNSLTEERLFADVGLWNISGRIDFYFADKVLWDYKVTTMYVLIDGVKPEWEAQGNINAYLLDENSFDVNAIKICCIFRDWSKIQAMKNPNYMSRKQVAVLDVNQWGRTETYDYILHRINLFVSSEDLPDNELPECTAKERWEKPTQYAAKKKDAKRATKLFSEKEAAEKFAEEKNLVVETRIGESTRCEYYCSVSEFCQQYKKTK